MLFHKVTFLQLVKLRYNIVRSVKQEIYKFVEYN